MAMGALELYALHNCASRLIMKSPPNVSRAFTTMFSFPVLISQVLEFVHSTKTDSDAIPDGRARRFIHGEAGLGVAELERWTAATTGFVEDKLHNIRPWLLTAGSLILVFFWVSTFILLRCWKAASHDMKAEAEPTAAESEAAGSTSQVINVKSRKASDDPYLSDANSDVLVSMPTLPKESLNHFPSKLAISVYTGFTTGVGPRR